MAGENRAERLPATTISNPKPYWEALKSERGMSQGALRISFAIIGFPDPQC